MASSINPSNSHVLNTLVLNAGQLRILFSDVTELSVSSSVSLSFNKTSFIESDIISTSEVSSDSVLASHIKTSISTQSSIKIPVVIRKHLMSSISGDTESVLYTVFRRSETDILGINTTSTLNVPFVIKKAFNTNTNSNSNINTINAPVKKFFNTSINNTSLFNINTIKHKLININITGDTEAFNYTIYRDVNTGITSIITRSNVIVPTIIKHYYNVSTIDTNSTITYSSNKNIISCSNIESSSSLKVIIPTTVIVDTSSINASTDSNIFIIRRKINNSNIIASTSMNGSANLRRFVSSFIKEDSSGVYYTGRNKYIQSSFITFSDVHIEQSGFLLCYDGKIKLFICPASPPHHPEKIRYKVRGEEIKEKYPLNSFILCTTLINQGEWTTSSYHFDTAETIKENTILDIHEVKEPVVIECDNKHSLFFTPTTKSGKISLTPVVGKELKYNGHKIFE